jgi:protein phosphatase
MLDLEFAELSDSGLTRDHNEDFLGHVLPASPAQVQSQGWLFALADGVGGQEHGEVASRLAIETVQAGFRKVPKGIMHVSLLPRLVQEANHAIFDQGNAAPHHSDARYSDPGGAILPGGTHMATTLVLCALRFDSAVVSHVGDSRCYLARNGNLTALTHDHTMVDEQVRLGLLSKTEAASAVNRHMHGYVSDTGIQQIVASAPSLDQAAAALVAAANAAGGYDNVSVQLIRVRSVERMGLYRGRPYRLL